jgi:hypothetical protein
MLKILQGRSSPKLSNLEHLFRFLEIRDVSESGKENLAGRITRIIPKAATSLSFFEERTFETISPRSTVEISESSGGHGFETLPQTT